MKKKDPTEIFEEYHTMVSSMLGYPPFSVDGNLRSAVQEEISKLPEFGEPPNPKILETYYEPVLEKFAMQFEEASLWQSRYPTDREDAARAALEMEGLDDWEIDIRVLTI